MEKIKIAELSTQILCGLLKHLGCEGGYGNTCIYPYEVKEDVGISVARAYKIIFDAVEKSINKD